MTTYKQLFEEDEDGIGVELAPFLVVLTQQELDETQIPILESIWQPSHIRGLWYRVDPVRQEMKQLRHVHVAQKKHIRSKDHQASWNDNATRHDRKTFNADLGSRSDVQAVARAALGLSSTTILENLTSRSVNLLILTEADLPEPQAESHLETASAMSMSARLKKAREDLRAPGREIAVYLYECSGKDYLIWVADEGAEITATVFHSGRPWGPKVHITHETMLDSQRSLNPFSVERLVEIQKGFVKDYHI